MPTKIDERTVIPLGWVVSGFSAMAGIIIVGTFWVASVNMRLGRIEKRLGMADVEGVLSIPKANAGTEK